MLTLRSPAKLNLFLRILGKRPDGYHELASLFQSIDLFDIITIQLSDQDRFSCSDSSLPLDQNNLVVKSLQLFRENTGILNKFSIHLEKRIPVCAGLGGGSGNAATTLWGLNELLGRPASLDQLREWSSRIGSDIPFFFTEGTAYCTGRGEIIESIPPFNQETVYLIKPSQGLATKEIFKRFRADFCEKRDPKAFLVNFLQGKRESFNDLEIPAFEIMPSLSDLKLDLQKRGFHTVCMTGSGSTLFCLGTGSLPERKDYFTAKASFINRKTGKWY